MRYATAYVDTLETLGRRPSLDSRRVDNPAGALEKPSWILASNRIEPGYPADRKLICQVLQLVVSRPTSQVYPNGQSGQTSPACYRVH